MRSFPAEVVTKADGCRVGDILSERIHGVAELRFEKRIAGLGEVPLGAKNRIPRPEVRIDERTKIVRDIVLKPEDGRELPEPLE
jgi:hypothetical protein